MHLQVETITLPVSWASYLINGDASGLEDGEAKIIDAYLATQGIAAHDIFDVSDEPRFTWHFRLHGGDAEGGDVVDYQYFAREAA